MKTCFPSLGEPCGECHRCCDPRPCKGENSNVCVAEGCYGEACLNVPKSKPDEVSDMRTEIRNLSHALSQMYAYHSTLDKQYRRVKAERDDLADQVRGFQTMRWPEEAHRLQQARNYWAERYERLYNALEKAGHQLSQMGDKDGVQVVGRILEQEDQQ